MLLIRGNSACNNEIFRHQLLGEIGRRYRLIENADPREKRPPLASSSKLRPVIQIRVTVRFETTDSRAWSHFTLYDPRQLQGHAPICSRIRARGGTPRIGSLVLAWPR